MCQEPTQMKTGVHVACAGAGAGADAGAGASANSGAAANVKDAVATKPKEDFPSKRNVRAFVARCAERDVTSLAVHCGCTHGNCCNKQRQDGGCHPITAVTKKRKHNDDTVVTIYGSCGTQNPDGTTCTIEMLVSLRDKAQARLEATAAEDKLERYTCENLIKFYNDLIKCYVQKVSEIHNRLYSECPPSLPYSPPLLPDGEEDAEDQEMQDAEEAKASEAGGSSGSESDKGYESDDSDLGFA